MPGHYELIIQATAFLFVFGLPIAILLAILFVLKKQSRSRDLNNPGDSNREDQE